MTDVIFIKLNFNDDLIQSIIEEVKEEEEIDKKEILYDLEERYIDFETIKESDDEVEYKR